MKNLIKKTKDLETILLDRRSLKSKDTYSIYYEKPKYFIKNYIKYNYYILDLIYNEVLPREYHSYYTSDDYGITWKWIKEEKTSYRRIKLPNWKNRSKVKKQYDCHKYKDLESDIILKIKIIKI